MFLVTFFSCISVLNLSGIKSNWGSRNDCTSISFLDSRKRNKQEKREPHPESNCLECYVAIGALHNCVVLSSENSIDNDLLREDCVNLSFLLPYEETCHQERQERNPSCPRKTQHERKRRRRKKRRLTSTHFFSQLMTSVVVHLKHQERKQWELINNEPKRVWEFFSPRRDDQQSYCNSNYQWVKRKLHGLVMHRALLIVSEGLFLVNDKILFHLLRLVHNNNSLILSIAYANKNDYANSDENQDKHWAKETRKVRKISWTWRLSWSDACNLALSGIKIAVFLHLLARFTSFLEGILTGLFLLAEVDACLVSRESHDTFNHLSILTTRRLGLIDLKVCSRILICSLKSWLLIAFLDLIARIKHSRVELCLNWTLVQDWWSNFLYWKILRRLALLVWDRCLLVEALEHPVRHLYRLSWLVREHKLLSFCKLRWIFRYEPESIRIDPSWWIVIHKLWCLVLRQKKISERQICLLARNLLSVFSFTEFFSINIYRFVYHACKTMFALFRKDSLNLKNLTSCIVSEETVLTVRSISICSVFQHGIVKIVSQSTQVVAHSVSQIWCTIALKLCESLCRCERDSWDTILLEISSNRNFLSCGCCEIVSTRGGTV